MSIPRHCTSCCHTQDLEPRGVTVNHLPLLCKRRRWSPGHGGRRRTATHSHLRLHLQYWHLTSINPQGPGGFSSSPALLVALLYEHHGALQYSATNTPLLDVRPTAGTRINPVSRHCLASAIKRPILALLLVSVGTTFRTDKRSEDGG
jgi:hypothetical protein